MQTNTVYKLPENTPLWLDNFIDIYQKLSTSNLSLLADVYHKNVTFADPIHQVEGFNALYKYFENLYQNLSFCQFAIKNVIVQGDEAAVYWEMSYQHKKLNKGQTVKVLGTSHIKGSEDKVVYHRDYLDLGAMLYEQLPFFGKVIKWIKVKAAQ